MRVLFTVSSWPTHYASMVPLGWALQAAGHEVRVLCAPSQVGTVVAAGLIPVPSLDGMDVRTRLRLQYYEEAVLGLWRYPWLPPHPLTGGRLNALEDFDAEEFRRSCAPQLAARAAHGFDSAVRCARDWQPHLVLHDPASLEGLLVAKVLGLPSALCLWGPVGLHEPEHMRIVPTDESGSFPRYGLGEFSPDMVEYVIDPCPSSLAQPTKANRLPVRYVPYNGCAPAPEWLLAPHRRPRVCVSWSTALSVTSGPDSYLLPDLVRGLKEIDADVIVTATAADVKALGLVPRSVRLLERMPLRLLLAGCETVVHHGGSGSILTSLWAGVPQVAFTFASEQTVAAERVAAAGAGLHRLGHQAEPVRIAAMVAEVLSDDSYRTAAAELRAQMRARPTPADLVRTLEELAAA
ncbi:nucleotide disphospho-sugar-binding domain-containing protein [Streptomyces sp. NPDC020801]|uniref:nucleotide disphospho-sugar-binding domain-containing protein n=1 Tax=unclassified Streptomyces TaxID=2593676 RepID=UPI0037AB2FCD